MIPLGDRREMYELLRTYFTGTSRGRFEADLREKEAVILLRDASTGRVQGFSTFMRIALDFDGSRVVAFFSGDTIVDREFWGETVLSRIWGQTIVNEAEGIRAQQPDTDVYWFLICSGYKTWRFLPVFFREFYPTPDAATPPHVRRLIDTLGTARFGGEYVPDLGVVRFQQAAPLRRGVADITEERLRDPRIAFFARMNPGHTEGDELACLAPISRANLTKAGLRMVSGSFIRGDLPAVSQPE
jgi:hypothetical protein